MKMPFNIQNPEKWGNEYADYFKFEDKYGNEKLPIIPDFRITKREEGQQSTKVFLPKIENYMAKFPAKTTEQVMLKELKKKIKSRVGKIVKILAADLKLGRTYRWLAVSISKRRMSNYVIETIEKGLANQGLLQDKDKEEETPAC